MVRRSLAAVTVAFAVMVSAACGAATTDDSTSVGFDGAHVAAAQFQEAIDQPGVVVIDVRTPEEFAEGHLPGALNIDVSATDFPDRIAELDRSASYAVYCRTANRSQVALDVMASEGFTSVVGMAGGIVAWPGSIVQP